MYNVSSEQQLRITNASYVVCYLALKGFTVYSDMYEYSVEVEIHLDSFKEVRTLIEAMKPLTNLYKKREIKRKRMKDGTNWYVTRFNFK